MLDFGLENVLSGFHGGNDSEDREELLHGSEDGTHVRISVFRGVLFSEKLIIHLIIHSVYLLYSYYT